MVVIGRPFEVAGGDVGKAGVSEEGEKFPCIACKCSI